MTKEIIIERIVAVLGIFFAVQFVAVITFVLSYGLFNLAQEGLGLYSTQSLKWGVSVFFAALVTYFVAVKPAREYWNLYIR